jgi:hypothetical protein
LIQDAIEAWPDAVSEGTTDNLCDLLLAMDASPEVVLPGLLDLYREATVSPHPRNYGRGVERYLRSQGAKAIEPLSQGLRDADPGVRVFAMVWAELLGSEAKVLGRDVHEAMKYHRGFSDDRESYKGYEHRQLVQGLTTLLAIGDSKESVKDLVELMEHRHGEVQVLATTLLGTLGEDVKEALPALDRACTAEDPLVVIAATEARLRIDGQVDRAVRRLELIVADRLRQQEHVRAEAVAALCRLGAKAKTAMRTFQKLARSKSERERQWAARAYWTIAGETQTAVSLCMMALEDRIVDEPTICLLGEMGEDAQPAVPLLAELTVGGVKRRFDHMILSVEISLSQIQIIERALSRIAPESLIDSHRPRVEHLRGGIGP